MSWLTLFRAMAVCLLLLTGVELFACELLSPETCELADLSNTGGGSSGGDDCFCCCSHVTLAQPADLNPSSIAIAGLAEASVVDPISRPHTIYHPPKS